MPVLMTLALLVGVFDSRLRPERTQLAMSSPAWIFELRRLAS